MSRADVIALLVLFVVLHGAALQVQLAAPESPMFTTIAQIDAAMAAAWLTLRSPRDRR